MDVKTIKSASAAVVAFCLLGGSLGGCSSSDDTVEERGTDTLQQEDRIQAADVIEAEGTTAAGEEQEQTHSASIHRTIEFRGNAAALDQRAEQSLSNVAQAVNPEIPVHVTVRMVDPNDVSKSDVSAMGEQRAEVVRQFLRQQGVEVAQMRVEKYSSREYESAQDSQALQDELETTSGLSELRDADQGAFADVEQEIVLTLVTNSPSKAAK